MPSLETLYLFALACCGLVLLPGPAVIYIVTRGVVHGHRGGFVSMLGVETGNLIQVFGAAAGLAAIVASSATAFSVVKYAGAAYLGFLGVSALLKGDAAGADGQAPERSERHLYLNGFVVGALNPKLALFLLAFLPQFIHRGSGPIWAQTLILGLLFSAVALIGDSLWALAAATAGGRVRAWLRSPRLTRASGFIYLGLGAAAALTHASATD